MSTKLNDGGPAFPIALPVEVLDRYFQPDGDREFMRKKLGGMSLRSYALIHLASGQLANSAAMKALYDETKNNFPTEFARRSAILADALLAELNKETTASEVLTDIRQAKQDLAAAEALACVCAGFTLQYEQGCQCERGKAVKAAKAKLDALVQSV